MMVRKPPDNSFARSRFALRIIADENGAATAVRITNLSRNTVLFDWRGAEARCLLESHDLLRRHGMQRRAPNRWIPISKTSIWHLALHVAAIRCLLNRCTEERARTDDSTGCCAFRDAASDAEYQTLHQQVLALLRASANRRLSTQDVCCLLALSGSACSPARISIVLADLCRWGIVRRCNSDLDNEIFVELSPKEQLPKEQPDGSGVFNPPSVTFGRPVRTADIVS